MHHYERLNAYDVLFILFLSVFSIKRHLTYALLSALEAPVGHLRLLAVLPVRHGALMQKGDTNRLMFLQGADRWGAVRQLSKVRGHRG